MNTIINTDVVIYNHSEEKKDAKLQESFFSQLKRWIDVILVFFLYRQTNKTTYFWSWTTCLMSILQSGEDFFGEKDIVRNR